MTRCSTGRLAFLAPDSRVVVEMMELERHGDDVFVGTGPAYFWGGLFGGQIVAQALRAAGHTVQRRFRPHSLHAYFIRPGDHAKPIRFEVERLRDGRSFVTRQVVARQSGAAILTMISSFHVGEVSPGVQIAVMPETAGPDHARDTTWSKAFSRRELPPDGGGFGARGWFRIEADLGDDPVLPACGLAYMSDELPIEPVQAIYLEQAGGTPDQLHGVSLDHAVWFHTPARADEWHLQDVVGSGLGDGRGVGRGALFSAGGTHIASVAQEALIRRRQA